MCVYIYIYIYIYIIHVYLSTSGRPRALARECGRRCEPLKTKGLLQSAITYDSMI